MFIIASTLLYFLLRINIHAHPQMVILCKYFSIYTYTIPLPPTLAKQGISFKDPSHRGPQKKKIFCPVIIRPNLWYKKDTI